MTGSESDLTCPRCNLVLKEVRTSKGIFWACDQCQGRAITVELLRRIFTAESINPLWKHAISGQGVSSRLCPACQKAMTEVNLSDDAGVKVDVCQRCHFVWFDAGETKSLVPRPAMPAKPPMPQKAREAIAFFEVERLAEEARRSEITNYSQIHWWTPIISLLFDF